MTAAGIRLRDVAARSGPFAHERWRATFLRWGVAGVLLRLLLLPVGVTTDTLAVYWRAHLIPFHGEVFSDYLVNMGAHLVHSAWLVVVQPLLGPAEQLWTHPWWWEDLHGLAPAHLEAFLARDDALRAISLLKTPYALADLAAGLLLLALVWPRDPDADPAGAARTRRLWIFWMLSPVMLYATLVFGRYESFPVLAVVAALFLAERRRTVWAAVALGVAVTMRGYPLLFVPVFALVLYRDLPRQLAWSALAVAPFALTMVANRVVGGTYGELATVSERGFADNWFVFSVGPPGRGILLFFAAAFALGTYLLGRARGWWGTGPVARIDLWRWLALAHLGMFAFAHFSPHYLAWIVPAVALLLARTERGGVVPLHLVQFGGVFVATFATLSGVLFTAPLGGLGPTARTLLPAVPGVVPEGVAQPLGDLAWTAFVVATLALALPLLLDTLRTRSGCRAVAPLSRLCDERGGGQERVSSGGPVEPTLRRAWRWPGAGVERWPRRADSATSEARRSRRLAGAARAPAAVAATPGRRAPRGGRPRRGRR